MTAKLATLALCLAAAATMLARGGPAYPGPVTVVQPDGTRVTATLGGDEHLNWVSVEGRVVQRAADGFWHFVVLQNGVEVDAPERAGLEPPDTRAITPVTFRQRRSAQVMTSMYQGALATAPGLPDENFIAAPSAVSGTQPLLVLLVEFTNRTLTTAPAAWANAFFGTTGKTVRTYYDQVSMGAFHFVAASETQGTAGDGIVRVQLPYAHPNTGTNTGTANFKLVADAVKAADPYVNFALYDRNHDGYITASELHVVTVVAGFDRSYSTDAPSVWGHRAWGLQGSLVDGVYAGGEYTQEGELHADHQATIGILCHELGHDIGLPDLYDTTYASEGIGAHCLMSSGSWGAAASEKPGATPTLMSAWCRFKLGFLVPETVTTPGHYVVREASDGRFANSLLVPAPVAGQYFLVENRQLSGFDAGLYQTFLGATGVVPSSGGLAIWHVDENRPDNTAAVHKLVDLEEADEGALGYSELDTRHNRGNRAQYFFAANAARFDETTIPGSRLYDGAASGVALTAISAPGITMTLDVGFSDDPTAPEEVTGLGFEWGSRVHLNWIPSAGTDAYDLFRGDIPRLDPADYGGCLNAADPGRTGVGYDDADEPIPGTGYFYLVRPRRQVPPAAGTLGQTSTGQPRVNANPARCP